ncbi:hypothetical protein HPB47_018492 [Ixodes persulcatus]|uniref:Uncharacterized protein n=1 Tax=Ixodes persulcatus TaxID=34615 RepID=A0AC60R1H1_IXOPE|nr:hypothetical protein HPB47_018492 [Ixodes persulcatus]
MATSTGPTPPSPYSSHPASTDQYSLPSSVCGSSIAQSDDKDTPMNSAEDITPVITSLSSLRLSNTLAKTFPECILEIRYNSRLNLVAVDVRNEQTTRGLLRCTELCRIKVRAYEPLPRHCVTGLIKDVDTTLTDEEITNNLKVQSLRSLSADLHCQASSTLVLFGIQLLHSKRNLSNAASAAAMDTVRPPTSTVLCASAAVTRTRTETPALLKRATVCLERLGVTNTLEELIEAHRAAQLTRLRCTAQGRALLATLGFPPCPASLTAEGLSPAARARLTVAPIPRHMNPTLHSARRDHHSRYLRHADAVLWRQLQTNTFPTPLFYSYLHPSLSPPQRPHCGDRPNLFHVLWQCQLIPAVPPNPNPTPTSWEERLTDDTASGQQSLVDRAKAVAATYGAAD